MEERSSLILRTNPRLAGNAKLIIDSNNKIYLESIPINDILSQSQYSKIINPNSDYSEDLYSLFHAVPNDIFYEIKKDRDDIIYSSYNKQFEQTYNFGAKRCTSKLYDEQFSIFAPLLLGTSSNKIPKYFCIFKIDTPKNITHKRLLGNNDLKIGYRYKLKGIQQVKISHNNKIYTVGDNFIAETTSFKILDQYSLGDVYAIIDDPIHETDFDYLKDFISPSNLLKVIDIANSPLGQYIRNLFHEPLFQNPPLHVDFENKKIIYTGISVSKGKIIQKEESIEFLMEKEKPIKEFDQWITEGFYRNGLVMSNLLNLEFLFDDNEESFSTNRYYGFYCDDVDFWKFSSNDLKTVLTNQNKHIQSPSYYYIKNIYNQLIKLNNRDSIDQQYKNIVSTQNDNYVFEDQIKVNLLKNKPIPSTYLEMKVDTLPIGYQLRLLINGQYKESIIADTLANLNEKDLQYKQWKDEGYLMNYFNPEGTQEEVLIRMSKALKWLLGAINNYTYRFAIHQNRIHIFTTSGQAPTLSITVGANDKGEMFIFSETLIGYTPYQNQRFRIPKIDEKIFSSNCYLKSISGKYLPITSISDYLDDIELESNGVIKNYQMVNDYSVVTVECENNPIIFVNDTTISLYKKQDLKFGCFDICPISDFDYDFYSESYTQNYEHEYYRFYNVRNGFLELGESYYLFKSEHDTEASIKLDNKIYKVSDNNYTELIEVTSKNYEIINGNPIIINKKFYDDEELLNFSGFFCVKDRSYKSKKIDKIEQKFNNFPQKSNNEYDVLQENLNTNYAYLSKTVPIINKWVMKEKDIRDNNYRLNLSSSFGNNSFSPSFTTTRPDPSNFTSEWYYLSSYPQGMTDEEIYNSTSYFDHIFDQTQHNSFSEDYFTKYFTVNKATLLQPYEKISNYDEYTKSSIWKYKTIVKKVKYQKRYSIIEKVSNNVNDYNYQTFFRGVRINFYSPKIQLTNYKFAAILNIRRTELTNRELPFSIKISRNDKFKNIVFIIDVYIDDYKILDVAGNVNCGYLYLYISQHLRSIEENGNKLYGMPFRMKEYTNQIITIGNREEKLETLKPFSNSVIYGSKFPMVVGTKYADYQNEGSDTSVILQFDDTNLQLLQWYGVNEKGSYPNLLGLNKNQVLITSPIAHDTVNRTVIFNPNETNVKKYDIWGLSLGKLSQRVSESTNRILYDGGISLMSSSNFTPIGNKKITDLRRMIQMSNLDWIKIGGGYEQYNKISQYLTFSYIANLIKENSIFVTYYVCDNDDYKIEYDHMQLTFIEPSEIHQSVTLETYKNNHTVPEYPEQLIFDYKIKENKNVSAILHRYSGKYYPKINEIFQFKNVIRDISWKEEYRSYKQVKSKWRGEYKNGEEFQEYETYTWNSDPNKHNLHDGYIYNEKNYIIEKNPILHNTFYHKISHNGNKIINTDLSAYEKNKEINIDKKNVRLLGTSFDSNYYEEYVTMSQFYDLSDYSSLKENKTYFGSILTNLPHDIIFGDFSSIIDLNKEIEEINTSYSIKLIKINNVVNFEIDIEQAFYEKYGKEVGKYLFDYIDEKYTQNGDREKFIKQYCSQVLLPNYNIISSVCYVKENGSNYYPLLNSILNELTLIKKGYKENKNVIFGNYTNKKILLTIPIDKKYDYNDYSYNIILKFSLI